MKTNLTADTYWLTFFNKKNNIVYKYDCKDCEAVCPGESKRTTAERTKEHTRAIRPADTRRYETADHCWKYNHDFNWENKKIMNYEANTITRKIRETIHSLSNTSTHLVSCTET